MPGRMGKKPLSEEKRPFERDEIAAYADAAARLCGIAMPATSRDGVIANLQTILNNSAALMALDLGWTDEAAPVFQP